MASNLLVVTLCIFVLLHHFGIIVVQSAVHLRQLAPWPALAERGGVVREGDNLKFLCESDEQPASDSTSVAIFLEVFMLSSICAKCPNFLELFVPKCWE